MVFKGLELRPGERVLWTGAAQDARLVDAPDYHQLVRGTILVGLGVGYLVLGPMTIGAPLVCAVGVGLLVHQLVPAARQLSRLRRGRYALTDQRVVVVYDRRMQELVQSELALLGPPLVHVDQDGIGTIAFDRTPILHNGRWHRGGGGPSMAGAPYLYRVAEPEQTADLILAAQEKVSADRPS